MEQPPKKPCVPKLVRFILVNSLTGVLIGWLIAGAFVYFNINGFGEMLMHSSQRGVVVFILALSFGITFGFAYMATAVWLLPWGKDDFDRIK